MKVKSTSIVVQSLSRVWLIVTPRTIECQASQSFIVSQSLLKFMSIESVMPSNHLILSLLLLLTSTFPALRSFPMSQLFASGGQSIGASTLASVLPMNIQGWNPSGLICLISLQSKGFSRVLQHHNSKALILWCSTLFLWFNSHVHNYWKKHRSDYMDLCQ